MAIQWYPGHMHKAQKEIKKILPKIDVIIEVIDARIPYSSANPVIAGLTLNKGLVTPMIKVINKTDLADPMTTKLWLEYLETQQNVRALPITSQHPQQVKKIIGLCRQLAAHRLKKDRPIRALIAGIPNVGKSTIINTLSDRKIAKVGNEPAVTKTQQRIELPNDIILFDTPGFLWPKIENEDSSYRLAITGAIKDTALEYDDIAYYAIDYLKESYPDALMNTFKLDAIAEETMDIIEAIGKKRGCLMSGGRVNLATVSTVIIKAIRSSSLGPLSFETPEMIEAELK